MGNEWVKVELYGANNDGQPRRYTIADGASVSIGSLMMLTTPRTASLATGGYKACAGAASEEHEASIGVTDISCHTNGIFRVVASDAIVAGSPLSTAESNKVHIANSAASGSFVIGYALENANDAGTFSMRLDL